MAVIVQEVASTAFVDSVLDHFTHSEPGFGPGISTGVLCDMGSVYSRLTGGCACQPEELVVVATDVFRNGYAFEVVRASADDQMTAQPVDERQGEFQARTLVAVDPSRLGD